LPVKAILDASVQLDAIKRLLEREIGKGISPFSK
jgi:hypothetical protein